MVPGIWFDGFSQLLTTAQGKLVEQLNSSLIHKVCAWLWLSHCNKEESSKKMLLCVHCPWHSKKISFIVIQQGYTSNNRSVLPSSYMSSVPQFTKDFYVHPLQRVTIFLLHVRITKLRQNESPVTSYSGEHQTKISFLISRSKLFLLYPHWLRDYYQVGFLENRWLKKEWISDRCF